MKRILTLLVFCILCGNAVVAQTYPFLDNKFAQFLLQKYPGCLTFIPPNHDTIPERFESGYVINNPVCSSIANEDSLNVSGLGIRNFTGIESFTSLQYLDVSYNNFYYSPAFPKTLKHLNYSNNFSGDNGPFGYMPLLPDSLTYLDFSHAGLFMFNFPKLPATLQYLDCSDVGWWRVGWGGDTTALPSSLIYLKCSDQIDYSVNSNLPTLHSLPKLPESLTTLICDSNALDSLPQLPLSLTYLNCSRQYNHPGDSYYQWFPTLFCLPKLPGGLRDLIIDTTIKCLPNYGLFGTKNLPLCQPSSGCPMPTNIYGTVFYDINQDGIKNGNDYSKSNIKLNLSNGISVFTDKYGNYKFPALSGNYTLTIATPTYYTAIPDTINFTFDASSDLFLSPIALQTNISVDSFKISIVPVLWAARPGFDYWYQINYENAGTTTMSPVITVNYDNSILSYDSSSVTGIINNGSSISFIESPMTPGQQKSFIAYFSIYPSAFLGDTLKASAALTAGSFSTKDSTFSIVNGSYDPNDKTATTQLTPQQVVDGKYINYTIRFQNTGTDTAFTVVITDTLSSLLQQGTLEVISTSHPCNTTLTGNKVYFEFVNILLPDSNKNEPASHGFVNFRIKPDASVTEGASITNKASIYFDYNTAIVTNTATTLIKNPELSVQTYTFTGNGNWSNVANWSNGIIPPSNLSNGAQIIIDPFDNGECILDVPQTISGSSKLTVNAGKKFKVNGNLIIQ